MAFFCPLGTGLCLMELFSCPSYASSISCSFLRFNIEDNVAYWEQKQMKKCFHFILIVLSLLQHSHFVNFSFHFFRHISWPSDDIRFLRSLQRALHESEGLTSPQRLKRSENFRGGFPKSSSGRGGGF